MKISKRVGRTSILIIITIIIIVLLSFINTKSNTAITNYDDCLKSGGNILESFPLKCSIQGKVFTMEFSDKKKETRKEINFQTIIDGITTESRFTSQEFSINTKEEWSNLWKQISTSEEMNTDVNFEQETLIALFMGEQPSGGYALKVTQVVETDDTIQIYTDMISPGLGCNTVQMMTSPYTVISLSKTEKPLVKVVTNRFTNCYG